MKRSKPIESLILTIRGRKVLIDADLAGIYGVETRILNQAVKRNAERFPDDFVFRLNADEKSEVITNCDHLAHLKFAKSLPLAFTEHGAIMAALAQATTASPAAAGTTQTQHRLPHLVFLPPFPPQSPARACLDRGRGGALEPDS